MRSLRKILFQTIYNWLMYCNLQVWSVFYSCALGEHCNAFWRHCIHNYTCMQQETYTLKIYLWWMRMARVQREKFWKTQYFYIISVFIIVDKISSGNFLNHELGSFEELKREKERERKSFSFKLYQLKHLWGEKVKFEIHAW